MPLISSSATDTKHTGTQDSVVAGRVLAVVVLYNKRFDEIPCAAKIQGWLAEPCEDSFMLHLAHCLVYDNSPRPLKPALTRSTQISFLQDPLNGGTRAAYMAAIDMAIVNGYSWILLLDHDTGLPHDFFTAADHALQQALSSPSIAAVIPLVFDGAVQASPSWITSYGRVRRWSAGENAGFETDGFTAIASAALIQTRCLATLLPIPESFKLDYLDHWLFRGLQGQGGTLAVSSAKINHSLSVFSMQSMGLERYSSILAAERLFLRGDHSYSRVKHGLWHLLRTVKLALLTRRLSLLGVCLHAARNIIRGP